MLSARAPLLLLWIFTLTASIGTSRAASSMEADRTDTIEQDSGSVVIRSIVLSGNRRTRDRIILRELLFREGDTLRLTDMYAKLERSRQNLMNTALFNTVSVLPVYIDPQNVIIEVSVRERWYIWPSVSFELADPNFNTWWETKDLSRINYGFFLNKYNFRGQNETIYVMAQFGYAEEYAFRYSVPYIDRAQRWGMSVGGSYLQRGEVIAGTFGNERILVRDQFKNNLEEQLADVEFTWRRYHDFRHHFRLGFNQAAVRDTVRLFALDFFSENSTRTRYLNAGYSLIWDTRDLRYFPRKGHFMELRFDRLGLGLLDLASPDITTFQLGLQRWFRLSEKFTFAPSLNGKTTIGDPPYYVQQGLGYDHQIRGYEYYVIDGQHFAYGRANLIYQLIKPRAFRIEAIPLEAFRDLYFALYLNVYTDAGYVWDELYADRNFLANTWLNGHGLGIDLVTSYDQVVRAEYSLNGIGEHGFFLHFKQPF